MNETGSFFGNIRQNGWRQPEVFLVLTAIAMYISFPTWQALFNNFAKEQAALDGSGVGWIQGFREVPGFLAFTAVFLLLWLREQSWALLSLIVMGVGTAVTGAFPSFWGLMLTTFVMSVGFHYFETYHQSLSLQWTDKTNAPVVLSRIVSARSFAALISFALVYFAFEAGGLGIETIYVLGGGATLAIGVFCWLAFPKYAERTAQRRSIVIRSRYWLWYALTFMSGARRQIFMVFGPWLMVDKFDFAVSSVSLMFAASMAITIFIAPRIGRYVKVFGERNALIFEYVGLIGVFVAYAFVDVAWIAVGLFILDNLFFAFAIAIKTYFQKIADTEDIASSSGVSFTISHIAAVFIPVLYGYIWIYSSTIVFLSAAAMAGASLIMAFLVPRHPDKGAETILSAQARPVPAE